MDSCVLLLTLFLSSLLLLLFFKPHHHHHLPPAPWSRLPIIGHLHLLGSLVHHSLHRLSLRYGPFFSLRFGSVPCVVVSNPHYAKLFLQDNELSFSSRLESAAIKRLTYDASLAFSPYGPYWKFVKKLAFNELFGSRGTNNFKSMRAREYDGLMGLVARKARAREPVNVTEELLKLTNGVISKMMLGESEEARDVIREVTKMFGEFNVGDFVPMMRIVDFQGYGKRIEDLFMRVKDFLDILLNYIEKESSEIKINRTHIKGLVMDFFTAATDTLAVAIEWALVELMNHPKILQKARQEIHEVIGDSRVVDESDGPNLPFIQAIIKETFRLHPPVPLVIRRCTRECAIENYVIPEDTVLIVNVWAMGRNPSFWESPLDFKPERFLKPKGGSASGSPLDVRGQHFQYLPFGSGRRMCSGLTLAMQEVPAVVAALIQCFDFQVVGPHGGILKGEDAIINVDERPGLTVPRAHDLVCVPIVRPICDTINLGP
ncbi:licodione synthase-like [Senna tora]|uniref:Licodione synthase-like n=1 Tax=Senna tora TaxID=362788 RepID=A0A834TK18_9FABA|nr:licodione synthase-like [Senna tora]